LEKYNIENPKTFIKFKQRVLMQRQFFYWQLIPSTTQVFISILSMISFTVPVAFNLILALNAIGEL